MGDEKFTIAVAVSSEDVLRRNLLASRGLIDGNQLVIRQGFSSASIAYNSAIDEAQNDIIIFAHQDLYLPPPWISHLRRCLEYLQNTRANWGVLGCYGFRNGGHGGFGRIYTNGLGRHGQRISRPVPIDTLDEIVLIMRKSSGLRFDPQLPHFHLYGTDICLTARQRGMSNHAFQGFCVHNTNQLLILPDEFYTCYRRLRHKWRSVLPIDTSCIKISLLNAAVYRRKIAECRLRVMGRGPYGRMRVDDPRALDEGADAYA